MVDYDAVKYRNNLVNRVCHPGGRYWNYNPGVLYIIQVTAPDLKMGHP